MSPEFTWVKAGDNTSFIKLSVPATTADTNDWLDIFIIELHPRPSTDILIEMEFLYAS